MVDLEEEEDGPGTVYLSQDALEASTRVIKNFTAWSDHICRDIAKQALIAAMRVNGTTVKFETDQIG